MQTATLSLYRFDGTPSRLWVLGQMASARPQLARIPGLGFYKLCGSGTGEGFTPRPNWGVWAIFGVWRDDASARTGLDAAGPFAAWAARARESTTFHLSPIRARGRWSGRQPFEKRIGAPSRGPLAALTRATLRPARALRFWNRVPDISARIGADPNVLFKIGIGEVPFLHQITFSVWPDEQSMAAFARTGPHAAAIRAVRDEGWFRDELYARFRLIRCEGRWHGVSPLSEPIEQEAG